MKHPMLVFLTLAFALVASAQPVTFVIQPGEPSNVKFHSEATIESFDGNTSVVKGEIVLDPASLGAEASAWFEVDLLSLDTGLDMRNAHMRDNHLHTDKYPATRFDMTELVSGQGALEPGKERKLTAKGIHDLHGEQVERLVEATVTHFPDGSKTALAVAGPVLHVVCRFDVALAEHKVPRPQFLFMKVAESIQLEVDVWAVAK